MIDFDVDGDGKITAEEIAMKERMLEVELREEKAESQKFMAWVAMGMMIVFTVFLYPYNDRYTSCSPSRFAWVILYCTDRCGSSVYGSYSLYGRKANGQ